MPINTPSINTNIETGQTNNPFQDALLKALLTGQQASHDQSLEAAKVQDQHQMDLQGAQDRQKMAEDLLAKYGGKMGVGVSKEGVSLTPKDNTLRDAALQERKDKRVLHEQEGLSKRYEKMNNFNSDLDELERITNTDGKGGVITNPDAKLKSAGKVMSALPDSLVGLGEFLGVVPKGTADERKARQRLQIDYQQAKSGMRVTDAARKQEAAAMGNMLSGDPDLAAKAIRSLGQNVKNQYGTIRSGYSPEAVENVHKVMGDPTALYQGMYQDHPARGAQAPAAPKAAPKSGGLSPEEQAELQALEAKYGGK
jgi:hypothetical protein